MRFLAGLILGLVVGAAATYVLVGRPAPVPAPVVAVAATTPADSKKGPRRQARRPQDPLPPPTSDVQLTAADLRSTSEGDPLRASALELDMSAATEPRDLGQDEIDSAFARRSDALIRCITDARAGAPVTGRVVVGVVVDGSGRVGKTRVEAPSWLIRHGLYACARGVLLGLRFPAAGKENVITVPFDLSE